MRQGVALSCSGVSLVVNSCLLPTKETMVHSQERLRLHILRNQGKSRQISEKGSSDTEKRDLLIRRKGNLLIRRKGNLLIRRKGLVSLLRKRRVRIVGFGQIALPPGSRRTSLPRLEDAVEVGAGRESTFGGDDVITIVRVFDHHLLGCRKADVAQPYSERSVQTLIEKEREIVL